MNKLQRYFNRKKRAKELHGFNPKRVRRLINQFFENEDIYRPRLEITDVVVKNKKLFIEITITLVRPGLLIGKQGRTIDALKEYLEKLLEKFVEIKIKESKIWW